MDDDAMRDRSTPLPATPAERRDRLAAESAERSADVQASVDRARDALPGTPVEDLFLSVDPDQLRARAVLAGCNAMLDSGAPVYADRFAAGLAAAVTAVLTYDPAIDDAKRAALSGPPHGVNHDQEARRAHMRGAILAAFTTEVSTDA